MSSFHLSDYNPFKSLFSAVKPDISVSGDLSNPHEPQIFIRDPALKVKMEEYLKACPGVSISDMYQMVSRGEEIEGLIHSCILEGKQLPPLVAEQLTSHDAVCLIWLLMVKAGQQDKLHISGSFRIDDPSGLIFEFLKACGKERCYGRISTHLKENVAPLRGQWGLDVRDQKLPAGKHTILFAQQPDQTLYMKIEESGCPPFWQKKHRSFSNFVEYIKHTLDYLITRLIEKPKMIKKTYREETPSEIKQVFVKAMDQLYESSRERNDKKARIQKGINLGISEMYNQLKRTHWETADSPNENEEKYIPDSIRQRIIEADKLGYQGTIKGEEVIFPHL